MNKASRHVFLLLSFWMVFPVFADSENKEILECKSFVRDSGYKDGSCMQVLLKSPGMTDADKAWLHYSLGFAFQNGIKNEKSAIEQYTAAIILNASDQVTFSSYVNRANSYLALCDILSAKSDLNEALKIWPNHKTAENLKQAIDNEKCKKQ